MRRRLAGAVALGHLAVINFTVAAGGGPGARGRCMAWAWSGRDARFNLALSTAVASDGYRQISSAEVAALQFRRRDLAQLGAEPAALGFAGRHCRAPEILEPADRTRPPASATAAASAIVAP